MPRASRGTSSPPDFLRQPNLCLYTKYDDDSDLYNGRSYDDGPGCTGRGKTFTVSPLLVVPRDQSVGAGHYKRRLLYPVQKHSTIQRCKTDPCMWSLCSRVTRRGRFFVTERRYRACAARPEKRLLFDLFSGAKENRGSTPNFEFETNKLPNRESFIQDGDSRVCFKGDPARRLASVTGSKGCVLPRTDPPRSQEVSTLLCKRKMLPVQGASLWDDNVTSGFHESSSSSYGRTKVTGFENIPLSRRHSADSHFTAGLIGPDQSSVRDNLESGIYDKCQEVLASTFSGHGVSRSTSSDYAKHLVSPFGKSPDVKDISLVVPTRLQLSCSPLAGIIRSDSLHSANDKMCSSPDEICSDAPSAQVESCDTRPGLADTSNPGDLPSPTMVDQSRPPAIRFAPLPPKSSGCSHDGCLLTRLGGRAWGGEKGGGPVKNSSGSVESSTTGMAHQHAGVDGGLVIPPTLRESSEGPGGLSQVGQHDDMCIHMQDGRNEVMVPVQDGHKHVDLVLRAQDNPESDSRSGGGQCSSRLFVKTRVGPERVEPPQSSSIHSVQDMGEAAGGPVCVCAQPQASTILFPIPVTCSSSSGCFLHRLGRLLTSLHVPPDGHTPKGTTESLAGPSQGFVDRSEVACQTMVCDDSGDASGDTHNPPNERRPLEPVQGASSEPTVAQLGGLENKRNLLRERGFQEPVITTILAARAGSTVHVYESRWKSFVGWCDGRGEDPLKAPISVIATFLQELFDSGRAWSTLRGYVAAISAFHPSFHENSLGSNKNIKDFVDGVYRLRPPVKDVVPRWELGVVLQALGDKPFEPPESACLQAWTWKTAFLLAITSAARVSELQALDSRPELLRLSKHKAVLRLNPVFLPKVPTPDHLNREIELAAFCHKPKDGIEKSLQVCCPVRALRIYLDKTSQIRKVSQLLVSYQAGKQGREVSKVTISRWIKQTILFSYRQLGRDIPRSTVKAHSTRAIASTLADIKGVSPADICAAATWSDACVFAKYYRLDMASVKSIASQVLKAAVADKS